MNCIFIGILWSFYYFKRDLFFGRFFSALIAIQDGIFDTLYAIFPLFLLDKESGKISPAIFHADSFLVYMSIFLPITFLSIKIYSILLFLTFKARNQWIRQSQFMINRETRIVSKFTNVTEEVPEPIKYSKSKDTLNTKQQTKISKYCLICYICCYGDKYLQSPLQSLLYKFYEEYFYCFIVL